ncbi:hypothetical protein L596_004861 [Steinernema carpocapsae]|uniref:Uncharacterized protein n=1 Tax=Steinernema carpocapsae TaxID=34508 RepID=A0A4U8UX84_STECR|nr:hypothetical protein L596_004861 [Steinernema carpocapsae]
MQLNAASSIDLLLLRAGARTEFSIFHAPLSRPAPFLDRKWVFSFFQMAFSKKNIASKQMWEACLELSSCA